LNSYSIGFGEPLKVYGCSGHNGQVSTIKHIEFLLVYLEFGLQI